MSIRRGPNQCLSRCSPQNGSAAVKYKRSKFLGNRSRMMELPVQASCPRHDMDSWTSDRNMETAE